MSYVAPQFREQPSAHSSSQKHRGKASRQKRNDDYREKQNAKILEDFRNENRAIIFGTEEPNDQDFEPIQYEQQIPVSTCGVGLAVQVVFAKLATRQELLQHFSIHSLYRVALAQLQLQLSVSQQRDDTEIFHRRTFSEVNIPREMKEAVLSNCKQFSLIAGIINSIGKFQYDGIRFRVGIPDHFPTWTTLMITNLREVVERLAEGEDPVYNANFLANNCLPGGIWVNNLLLNPDAIIPPNYGADELAEDFRLMSAVFDVVGRKVPTLKVTSLTYSGEGHPAQMITDYERPPIILPRHDDNDGVVFRYPLATTATYGSSYKLSGSDFRVGVLLQTGRRVEIGGEPVVDWYRWRSMDHVRFAVERSYTSVARYYVE